MKTRRTSLYGLIIIGASLTAACGPGGTDPNDIKPTPEECKLYDGFHEQLEDFGLASKVTDTWTVAKRPDATSDEVVLSKACGPYLFPQGLALETSLTLRIEAGTEVRFGNGPGIILGGDATFVAQGTAAEPVVLTAADGKNWQGITGFSKSVTLENVNIDHAGLPKLSTDFPVGGSAFDIPDSAPDGTYTLRNVHFSNCAEFCMGIGVFTSFSPSQTAKPFAAFENISFENSAYGMFLTENAIQGLPEAPKMTNVKANVLALFTPLTVEATLPAYADVPWTNHLDETHAKVGSITYSLRTSPTGSLTIPPGSILQNGPITRMDIEGKLRAVGTAAAPIRFEGLGGEMSNKGDWIGVSLFATGTLESDHLTIRGAGKNPNGGTPTPCLGIEGPNPRALKGVNIVNCQGPAVMVSNNDAVFTENTGNSFTNCDIGYAVPPNVIGSIRAAENTFKDVPKNHVIRGFSGSPAVLTTQTWDNLGIPWIVDETFGFGPDIGVDGPGAPTLTLAAGVKLKFTDGGLAVGWGGNGGGGRIVAQGTAAEPIEIELSGSFIDTPIEIRTTSGSSFTNVNFLGDKLFFVKDTSASFTNCTFAPGMKIIATTCGSVIKTGTTVPVESLATGQPCP